MIRCEPSDTQRAEVHRRLAQHELPGRIAAVTGLHVRDVERIATTDVWPAGTAPVVAARTRERNR